MRSLASLLAVLAMSGCALTPVSDLPDQPCSEVAAQHSSGAVVAEQAALGGVKWSLFGAGLDKALGSTVFTSRIGFFSSTGRIAIGSVAGAFTTFGILTGVIDGALEAQRERSRIERECRRDRGERVY